MRRRWLWSRQRWPFTVAALVLLAIALVWIYPLVWTAGASLKTQTGVFTSGLLTVAVIEALTIVLILIFIPRKRVE